MYHQQCGTNNYYTDNYTAKSLGLKVFVSQYKALLLGVSQRIVKCEQQPSCGAVNPSECLFSLLYYFQLDQWWMNQP